ncbi:MULTISPECIES: hypothetical protein [unclassified Sporolactobacillus]|nr:hypothetical protein [Sporolactobacillus sp. CQH2019]MDD9147916.1 hypothetical protein [Sporolactobacillus sp. CQH2019]
MQTEHNQKKGRQKRRIISRLIGRWQYKNLMITKARNAVIVILI